MSDNELLLAISNMIAQQMEPLKKDMKELKQNMKNLEEEQRKTNIVIENDIKGDIGLLVENFLPSAKKYNSEANKIEMLESKVELLEKVVTEHSEKLQKIS